MRRALFPALIAVLSTTSITLIGGGIQDTIRDAEAGAWNSEATVSGRHEASEDAAVLGAHGMRFGIDAESVRQFTDHAGKPDYGTVWVGKWNLDLGWRDTDKALVALRHANVTPAVHLYYWGDDISRTCLSQG